MKTKELKRNKGITLIALVSTIDNINDFLIENIRDKNFKDIISKMEEIIMVKI